MLVSVSEMLASPPTIKPANNNNNCVNEMKKRNEARIGHGRRRNEYRSKAKR